MADARVPLPPPAWDAALGARLLDALEGGAGATRFIGGWVRDTLLGLPSADIDLATRLAPADVVARFDAAGVRYWTTPSGLAHGTVTAMLDTVPVEITTLRRDMTTDGRRATVAYTNDWREDAERRDFTINALSADPASGEVHDYFGGLADLAEHRVRFIGDPLRRIAEDHLRILRFFRFHARFGVGAPDGDALAACTARANDLMALSRERIADELLKILTLPDPAPTVALMQTGGLFAPVLPEIARDAATRIAALVSREAAVGAPPDPIRRLAALLPHDPPVAEGAAMRLKLPNTSRRRIARYATPDAPSTQARRFAHGLPPAEALDLYLLGDLPVDVMTAQIDELDGWERPAFPLKGGELVKMGLRAGPAVAALLHQLQAEWIAADFPDAAWVADRARQALRAIQNS